jgi:adenine-specific DNA-methyltransferase
MKKITKDDSLANSQDVKQANLRVLQELFPEAFSEGHLDPKVLSELLPDGAIDDREEKYGLNWHGKRRARQLALTPSTGTLRPCPEESVDWDTTQNLMIEGDNLEVLKLLQKSYAGKVKMIYIDPPYNTGKDFVYPDDFQDNIKNYQMLTGQIDSDGRKVSSHSESSGRFHTDWLNMIYPRLKLAKNLLSDEGVVWISIDDTECANLRSICNDIFGEDNFVASFIWEKRKTRENRRVFSFNHDYIICFAKNKPTFESVRNLLPLTEEARNRYSNPDSDPRGDWQSVALTAQAGHGTPSQFYTITTPNGRRVDPPSGNCWRVTERRLRELIEDNRIWFGSDGGNVPRQKVFLNEQDQGLTPHTLWQADEVGTTDSAKRALNEIFGGETVFDTPKPLELLARICHISMGSSGIVVDFFAGSGATGHAVMAQNAIDQGTRRYFLVQLPEPLDHENKEQASAAAFCDKLNRARSISELTKERLRRAAIKTAKDHLHFKGDLGFRVFKLASSNINTWEPDRDNLDQALLKSVEHIKPDRDNDDIIYELLLKLGLDLCVPIEKKTIAKNLVYSIGAGALIVCLATKIFRDDAEPLALGIIEWYKQLNPAGESTVVFRDSAFADDVAKTNLAAILQQQGLENVRSL